MSVPLDFDPNHCKPCKYSSCSNYTSKSPYCASCLLSRHSVCIAPSKIKDRNGETIQGDGLFAMKEFKKGEFLGYYKGYLIEASSQKDNKFILYLL